MYFFDADFLDGLRTLLPPIFTRETASKMIGGIFTPRTLSNFDAAGRGPRKKIRVGKRVAYEKEDFLKWLEGRILNKIYKPNQIPKFYL